MSKLLFIDNALFRGRVFFFDFVFDFPLKINVFNMNKTKINIPVKGCLADGQTFRVLNEDLINTVMTLDHQRRDNLIDSINLLFRELNRGSF